jgi:hypothetical protein
VDILDILGILVPVGILGILVPGRRPPTPN